MRISRTKNTNDSKGVVMLYDYDAIVDQLRSNRFGSFVCKGYGDTRVMPCTVN